MLLSQAEVAIQCEQRQTELDTALSEAEILRIKYADALAEIKNIEGVMHLSK